MLIGFTGPARVGKDTAALALPNFYHAAFADALKREVKKMLSTAGVRVDFKDEQTKIDWRDMLVFWGRKRREQEEDYWIKRMIYHLASRGKGVQVDDVVITDVRYPNEVAWILRHRGQVIRLHRPDTPFANEEEQRTITAIDREFNLPQVQNDGSIEELKACVRDLLEIG